MEFKLNFSSSLFGGSNQASAESFESRRDTVLRKHAHELSGALRVGASLMMEAVDKLDTLLDDQTIADEVLDPRTRQTFKYFKSDYYLVDGHCIGSHEKPRNPAVHKLVLAVFDFGSELLTSRNAAGGGPIGHALHTFGYKVTTGDKSILPMTHVVAGRNFRIIFG